MLLVSGQWASHANNPPAHANSVITSSLTVTRARPSFCRTSPCLSTISGAESSEQTTTRWWVDTLHPKHWAWCNSFKLKTSTNPISLKQSAYNWLPLAQLTKIYLSCFTYETTKKHSPVESVASWLTSRPRGNLSRCQRPLIPELLLAGTDSNK